MQYVISDTHFFDSRMLGIDDFASRDYPDVTQMNQAMITAWNDRVGVNDVVYHLGDIAVDYRKHRPERVENEEIAALLAQLNGHLVLIKGNHDRRSLFKYLAAHNPAVAGQAKYTFHDVGALIKYDHHQLYLTHYPLMLGIAPQILNLHGHIHHYMVPSANNVNVGVDAPERDWLTPPEPFGSPLRLAEVLTMAAVKERQLQTTTKHPE